MSSGVPWRRLLHLWLHMAWRQRYLAASLILLMPVVGFLIGIFKTDVYQSKMTILIQESARHNPFLEDLAVQTRIKDRIKTLDALLHSRHVLLGVAVDLGLIGEDTPTREREILLRQLSASLSMRLIGDELIELRLKQPDAKDIDKTLFAVAQRFMEKALAPERSSIAGSVKFLDAQIVESTKRLSTAEEALSQFTTKHSGSLPELHAGNVRRLADLRLQLTETTTALESAKSHYSNLRARLAQSNPVVVRLEKKIVDLTSKLAGLRARYTDAHSSVQAAERQLRRYRSERKSLLSSQPPMSDAAIEELWASALSDAASNGGVQLLVVSQIEKLQEAQALVANLERQKQALQTEVQNLSDQVASLGEIDSELRDLQREASVRREIHEKLMERLQMAQVTGALGKFEAPERVKIVDKPNIPSRPAGIPVFGFVLLGLISGVVASIGLIAVLEFVDGTTRTIDKTHRETGLHVIARIPAMPDLRKDIEALIGTAMPASAPSPKT